MRKAKVFTGSSHTELANQIVEKLAISSAPVIVQQQENKELSIELGISVRNEDVFIIQSGSDECNDALMELLLLINSCKISSAQRITAIIPYMFYSKQSKKKRARGAISAKLVANMLAVAGLDHLIVMDLHSEIQQGFFAFPVDDLHSEPNIAKYIMEHVRDWKTGVVVSKNPGGVKRVTSLADRLKIDFAMIHRESCAKKTLPRRKTLILDPAYATSRESLVEAVAKEETEVNIILDEGIQLVGDVDGKVAFILDDMIDSPHSYLAAASLLTRRGASRVYIIATHGILSGNALEHIELSDAVHQIVVTNSYPISEQKRKQTSKLHVIDISNVLAEAIRRTHNGESISYLFHTPL